MILSMGITEGHQRLSGLIIPVIQTKFMICLVNWLFLCYVVYRGSIRFVTGLEMEVSRMKKIISLVLVVCMLFSLGVSAFADDQGEGPTQTASGGGESGNAQPTETGNTGGTESGGASGGGEPGGSGGESGGASGGTESGGGSGGGGESGGGSGGGTVTETVGNVYAGARGNSVTVGDNPVSFDASGQGDIPEVTKDGSGAIHINANVNGSDEAVKVEGNTTVIITGQVTSKDYGIVADGKSKVTVDSVSVEYGDGVRAGSSSTVNVIKNVYSEANNGVYAGFRTTVNVGGVVTSEDSTGVLAVDNKVVNVTGNVSGSDRGVYAYYGNVTVEGTVTATNGTGVYAEESSTVNAGDVTSANGTGVKAESGSTVTSGTVSAKTGIDATGGNTMVTVTGDVISSDTGIKASGGSVVTVIKDADGHGDVGGKTGVEATGGSTVEVAGGVFTANSGVIAEGGSDVTVGGDIEAVQIGIDAKGDDTSVNVNGNVRGSFIGGITVADGATVEVAGNVTNSNTYGVKASNGAEIDIGGNVEGKKAGILVEIAGTENEKASTILVEGTVSATGQNANAIQLNIKDGAAEEKVLETLPEIITKTIVPDADIAVVAGSGVDTGKVKQSLLDQVRYVVNMDTVYEPGVENTNLTVALVQVDGVLEEKTLHAGTQQEKTLTVATSSTIMNLVVGKGGDIVGGDVSGGEGHKVEANDDGSYKITVGKGVLNIVARVDKAVSPQPEPEPLPVDPDPVKPDPSPRSETVPVRQETVSTALVKLDYGHKNPLENILIIDMTTTNVAAFLTHTLRTFNRRNAIGTVMIKVANGSFTIAANDLLQLLDSEPACTFLVRGDMLEIRVGGETLASLVMTSTV